VPGATDVGTDELLGQPQVQIAVDREAIARSGLSVNDVQNVVETALGGAVATQVHEGERTFDLVVKMMPETVADLDSIRRIPVFGSNNERLTLGALTSVEVRPGFSRIEREENSRRTAVKLSVRGRDLGSLVAEAQQKVNATVKLPTGYRLEWTGSFENQQRAVKRLAVIVPITLIAIYFLLFTAFDSGRLAFLILLNVPFAAVGGVIALPIAGLSLSVSALVGFIALFGVSVQNGVLLVERIRVLRGRGFEMVKAIREGAISRVRPVVMTAAMAALGLLPAALSHEVGAETSRPFATVIIGGLVTATLLTLFIVPILYPWFEGAVNHPEPKEPTHDPVALETVA
jgi:cobalt-zinc-cadmium resistance protein CzcA